MEKILEQLKEKKIEFIEEIWVSYTLEQYNCICKLPNGRIYNYYDALNTSEMDGPFESIEQATETLESKYPNFHRVWESPDRESSAGNLDLTYKAEFFLSDPVLDIEAAQAYLTDEDMTKYVLGDSRIPPSGRDKIKSVVWDLVSETHGFIIVKTNEYLTEKESAAISDWISGQSSDGLGEGFEQQDFACYPDPDADDDDGWGTDEYIMCSFDWQTNKYTLILQE